MMVLAAAAVLAVAALLPGTYTNEEQVYFAKEAGKTAPPWVGVTITPEGNAFRLQTVDSFGVPGAEIQLMQVSEGKIDGHDVVSIATGACIRDYAQVPAGLTLVNERGRCGGLAVAATITGAGIAMRMFDGTALELQRARAFNC